jgi:hypothetical protein
MPRVIHKPVVGVVQHVISRFVDGCRLMSSDEIKHNYLDRLGVVLADSDWLLLWYALMSNHIQMIVQTKGKNLAKFMGYVKARIAETINLLTGKRGPLWSRRYDAQAILDDEAASDRLAYCLDNPVDACLVDTPDSWPGLNLAFGMGETDAVEFEYLDRTEWHKAGRSDNLDDFYRTATLHLSPLPQLKGMERSLVCGTRLGEPMQIAFG